MAESTYAVNCSTAIASQLARASIRTYGHTIKSYVVIAPHIECVRPYSVRVTTLRLAIACIKHEYQIHKTVSVLVIILEIYFRVKCLASVYHHRRSIYIAVVARICSIIGHVTLYLYRAIHIKLHVK